MPLGSLSTEAHRPLALESESDPFTPYKIVRTIQALKPAIIIKTMSAIDAAVKRALRA